MWKRFWSRSGSLIKLMYECRSRVEINDLMLVFALGEGIFALQATYLDY